jgi:Glycosyl hydrolase catalytic core
MAAAPLLLLLLLLAAAAYWYFVGAGGACPPRSCAAPGLQLGVATNASFENAKLCDAILASKLGFFWNWNYVLALPRDYARAAELEARFVPMFWGSDGALQAPVAAVLARTYKNLMLYNEPDLFSPGPVPFDSAHVNSSGTFAVNMHCRGEELVATSVGAIEGFKQGKPGRSVWSPSMADAAGKYGRQDDPDDTWDCMRARQPINHAGGDASPWKCEEADPNGGPCHEKCGAWLKCWKDALGAQTLTLNGCKTTAWDAVDVIQFHCYDSDAQAIVDHVRGWAEAWKEDLCPLGRKTLALTEVAMAGYLTTDPDATKCQEFMRTLVAGLRTVPQVSHVSWFSVPAFPGFATASRPHPAPNEQWQSNLFDETGQLTEIGKTWLSLA